MPGKNNKVLQEEKLQVIEVEPDKSSQALEDEAAAEQKVDFVQLGNYKIPHTWLPAIVYIFTVIYFSYWGDVFKDGVSCFTYGIFWFVTGIIMPVVYVQLHRIIKALAPRSRGLHPVYFAWMAMQYVRQWWKNYTQRRRGNLGEPN